MPMEEISHPGNEFRPDIIEPHDCGQWRVVRYDNIPYPGIILQVEKNNVEVKCLHCNGINMFYWPSSRDYVNYYKDDQIMCPTPEPLALNRHSLQIENEVLEFIRGQLIE